jgi:N6-adenosine-specific RNA methylase IME4
MFAPRVPTPPRAGQYAVLYPDFPWPENGGGKIKRGADKHYPTMKMADIFDLARAAGEWAAPNAHLYAWATNNYLPQAFEVVACMGFRYVTLSTWVKDRPGLGQYFRGLTEHCIFAVRGRLPYLTRADGKRAQGLTGFYEPEIDDEFPLHLPEAFEAPVPKANGKRIHSRKPQKMREYIEQISGDVPRLEMFARIATPGFDLWGNEAPEAVA